MENSTNPDSEEFVNKQSKSRIAQFLGIPIVALIGYLLGIFGTIFGVWTYFDSKVNSNLTAKLNPVKTIVVKSGQASKLQTIFDNKIIQTDVTAVQLGIWNRGKKPIPSSDILEVVTIQTENNTPILEATLLNQTRPVNQIQLHTEEMQQGKIAVSWKIMEKNDGALIQLIYAGDTTTTVRVSGVIVDQPQVTLLNEDNTHNDINNSQKSVTSNYLFLFLGIMFGVIAFLFKPIIAAEFKGDVSQLEKEAKEMGIYENERPKIQVLLSMQKVMTIFSKIMKVAFIVPSVLLIGYFFYLTFIKSSNTTPFGF